MSPQLNEDDEEDILCLICKIDIAEPGCCGLCEARYPDSLIKAHTDNFDYALGLRTGQVIRFEEAIIKGDYVHLRGDRIGQTMAFPCPRGVDVRIEDIVWCADAPEGS